MPPLFLRETLTSVLSSSSEESTAVLVGSSAGGVAAFNAVSWLLDSFDQARNFLGGTDGVFPLSYPLLRAT